MKNLKLIQNTKVISYRRVSTDEQKENGYSLQEQEQRINKYCEKNGWDIIADYQDDHSATSFKRPQWKVLFDDVKSRKNRPNLIIVTKIDRFSREASLSLEMINILAKYSIKIFSISENQIYDLKNSSNFFQQYFSIGMAQYENLVRADNTKRGMRQASKEGRTMGRAPVGYTNDKLNKTVQIDPVNGVLVAKGFELLSLGLLSIEEIRKKLIKEGLRNCCKQSFLNLVRNKYYYGVITIPAWDDEPEQEVIGKHHALISKDLFDKVQNVHFGKKKKANPILTAKEELPLRGKLYCHRCDGKLTGSPSTSRNGSKHFYYHCQKGCKERFRADEANIKFEDFLTSFKIDESTLNLYRLILKDVFDIDEHDRMKLIKQYNDKICLLDERLHSVQDKFMDNEINSTDFHSMKFRIKEEIGELKYKKEELSLDKSAFQKYIDYGLLFLYNMKDYYRNSNLETKQKIIGSIFPEKIIFFENKYRTTQSNELLRLIALNINDLEDKGNKKAAISSGLSKKAPPLGLEPRTL